MMLDTDTIIEEIMSKRLEVQFKEYFIKHWNNYDEDKNFLSYYKVKVNTKTLKETCFLGGLFLNNSKEDLMIWYDTYKNETTLHLTRFTSGGTYGDIRFYLAEYSSCEIIILESLIVKFYNEFMLDKK